MAGRRVVAVIAALWLAACGSSDTSRLPTVPTLDEQGAAGFASVSAGRDHTCALTTDGHAYCWGSDAYHQLGHPPTSQCDSTANGACSVAAEPVATTVTFRSISAGAEQTCGVSTGYTVYCWGTNVHGSLGLTADSALTPQPVDGSVRFSSVSAGYTHTCGVGTDGTAYCWGANDRGQLGTGDSTQRLAPTPVTTSEKFVSIAAGQGRTCGRTVGNRVLCWGAVWLYSEGGFDYTRAQLLPQAVSGAPMLSDLTVGSFTTCGIAGGAAYCWEANSHGEMGNGTTDGSTIPVPVLGGLRFASISAGVIQTCGTTLDGSAYCWGNDSFGQLGISPGALSNRCSIQNLPCALTPVRVIGWRKYTSISTGFGNHTCAVTQDTNIYCWGLGRLGQLGYGKLIGATSQPLKVAIALR